MRNKWISLGLVASTCFATSLMADSCNPAPKCNPPPPKCVKPPEPCYKPEPKPTCKPCCPENPWYMQDGAGFRAEGSALYMKSGTPNPTVGYQSLKSGGKTANGSVLELKSQMRWGWDVSVAYDFGKAQEAEVAIEWMHINAYWKQGPFTSTMFIIPTLADLDQITSVSSSEAHSRVKLDFVDITVGRRYEPFAHVTFKPFMGLSGLFSRQSWRQTVNGISVTQATAFTSNTKIDGIGLVVGTRCDWNIDYGFSLVGNFKFSLLYDYAHNSGVNYNITTPTDVFSKNNLHFHMLSYYMDLMLGAQYKYVSCDCKYEFGFGAGWKLSYFEKGWGIGSGSYFTNRNVGFQGLYLNAFFGF